MRSEIQNLSFTPKETDIYKIHQSGDLANLNGLDDASLKLLPSLLILRDAMYSLEFRDYLSKITNSGPLSGEKTDMAINVYTPGCHLLCHDDVIGSRRVSYILYLTDPDRPWEKEWGGALRLYPTQTYTEDGKMIKIPSPDPSVSIQPAFNQLSFFAVQPGESFHDVEEVYGSTTDDKEETRVRMAISGWYHIPQKGEDGYEEGLEDRLAEKSSLMQLQGKSDECDLPKSNIQSYTNAEVEGGLPTPSSQDQSELSEQEIDFLLKYIAPTYLTPDPLKEVSQIFSDECSICLENFLSRKFSDSIKDYIQSQESQELPGSSIEIEDSTSWRVARPPHKHRFLFQQSAPLTSKSSPLQQLLQDLFPSKAFQKWLFLTTTRQITSHNPLARRFRRGKDYTLATGYEEDSLRIELCLSLTPTPGWGDEQQAEPDVSFEENTKEDKSENANDPASTDHSAIGGYLAYMVNDEDEEEDETGSNHGTSVPADVSAGQQSTKIKPKQDPAIYRSTTDDEDDSVLFSMPACWNKLGIVLRDEGSMRFVKYVSAAAKGDRWDVVSEFEIVDEESEEEDTVDGSKTVGDEEDEEEEAETERDLDSDTDDGDSDLEAFRRATEAD